MPARLGETVLTRIMAAIVNGRSEFQKERIGECYELSPVITISSVEPLRTGASGQGPGQHRGPQVEPGGLWNSFWSSFRRASSIPCLPLPGTASKEYECQPFLSQHVM